MSYEPFFITKSLIDFFCLGSVLKKGVIMRKKKFNQKVYRKEKYRIIDGCMKWISVDEGFLKTEYGGFTKIKVSDLPEHYYGLRWTGGHDRLFIQTKGVVHIVFRESFFDTAHLFKYCCIYISYDKRIVKSKDHLSFYDNYDQVVYGNDIKQIVEEIKKHSNYDVRGIKGQITKREKWFEINKDEWLKR